MGLAESGTVSERHAAARADDAKLTAGELAKKMKKAGYSVSAKELAEHATEWHHAGWLPGGKGMGKCYFFRAYDAEPASMARLMERVIEARAEAAKPRYGWKVGFKEERGAYGRKRFRPVAEVREFAPGEKVGDKYTLISAEDYATLKPFEGRDLEPYESLGKFMQRIAGEAARG